MVANIICVLYDFSKLSTTKYDNERDNKICNFYKYRLIGRRFTSCKNVMETLFECKVPSIDGIIFHAMRHFQFRNDNRHDKAAAALCLFLNYRRCVHRLNRSCYKNSTQQVAVMVNNITGNKYDHDLFHLLVARIQKPYSCGSIAPHE